MKLLSLWELMLLSLRALGAHYGPAMDEAAEALGLQKPNWYAWLLAAMTFAPEPLTTARLRIRFPYTAPAFYDKHLAQAAQGGYLRQAAPGEYHLTQKGALAAEQVIQTAYQVMAELEPLPQSDLERLEGFLKRLVQACLEAPEPPGKWSLMHSRKTDRGAALPLVARIDQYLSDLNAYRDDAHLASWQPLGIEAHAWEAFTFLWRGEVSTLAEISAKLARRTYSENDYAQAIEDLTKRGWVSGFDDSYRLTPLGNDIRQKAEDTTNEYFFRPWTKLTQPELDELQTLLTCFHDHLQ